MPLTSLKHDIYNKNRDLYTKNLKSQRQQEVKRENINVLTDIELIMEDIKRDNLNLKYEKDQAEEKCEETLQ